jgi:hypothetical protein
VLNWLRGLFNRYGFPLAGIWNDFVNVALAVQSWDEGWLSSLTKFVNYVSASLGALGSAISSFIYGSYYPFTRWVQQQLFNTTVREHQDYSQIGNDIAQLQARTNQQVINIQQTVSSDISGLIKWIIQHIFDPLFGDITRALDWIAREGAYVFNLLTHADLLLAWLFHFLLGQWNFLLDKFGKLMLAWFLANWKLVAPLIVSTLEDIIAAILLGACNASSPSLQAWHEAWAKARHAGCSGRCLCAHATSGGQAQDRHDSIPRHLR